MYSDQTIKTKSSEAKILEVLLFALLLSRKDISYHGECVLWHIVTPACVVAEVLKYN